MASVMAGRPRHPVWQRTTLRPGVNAPTSSGSTRRRHVPNMYQHHGKQRGVAVNNGELKPPCDQVKWPSTRSFAEQRIRPHNPKVTGSNPVPATKVIPAQRPFPRNQEGPLALLAPPFVIHLSLENPRISDPRKFLGKNPMVTCTREWSSSARGE
jgi:hypothetical protein